MLPHLLKNLFVTSFLLLMMLLSLIEIAGNLTNVAEVLASAMDDDALAGGSIIDALRAAITTSLNIPLPPLPPPDLSALRFLETAFLDLYRIFLLYCDFYHLTSSSPWSFGRALNSFG